MADDFELPNQEELGFFDDEDPDEYFELGVFVEDPEEYLLVAFGLGAVYFFVEGLDLPLPNHDEEDFVDLLPPNELLDRLNEDRPLLLASSTSAPAALTTNIMVSAMTDFFHTCITNPFCVLSSNRHESHLMLFSHPTQPKREFRAQNPSYDHIAFN